MGILDAISAEDRVQVKFGDFYTLVQGCTQRDQMLNAIKCNVPHRYIREMVTGQSEEVKLNVGDKEAAQRADRDTAPAKQKTSLKSAT